MFRLKALALFSLAISLYLFPTVTLSILGIGFLATKPGFNLLITILKIVPKLTLSLLSVVTPLILVAIKAFQFLAQLAPIAFKISKFLVSSAIKSTVEYLKTTSIAIFDGIVGFFKDLVSRKNSNYISIGASKYIKFDENFSVLKPKTPVNKFESVRSPHTNSFFKLDNSRELEKITTEELPSEPVTPKI